AAAVTALRGLVLQQLPRHVGTAKRSASHTRGIKLWVGLWVGNFSGRAIEWDCRPGPCRRNGKTFPPVGPCRALRPAPTALAWKKKRTARQAADLDFAYGTKLR